MTKEIIETKFKCYSKCYVVRQVSRQWHKIKLDVYIVLCL